MERLISLLRAYPALASVLVIALVALALGGFFAVLMSRAGLSLKPIVFLGVFFSLILGPQLFFQILRVRGIAPDLTWTPSSNAAPVVEEAAMLAANDGKFVNPAAVFGAGFDPDLVSDVRRIFPTAPEVAQMAIFPNAESVVVARFSDSAAAQQGLRTYAGMMGFAALPRAAADGSFTAARASDLVRFFVVDRTLFAWTAADGSALDRRMQASSGSWQAGAPAAADPRVARWWKIMGVSTVFLVLIASIWFFKGSAWAVTIRLANHLVRPTAAVDLRGRLLAIENLRQPVQITAGREPDEIIVDWRADAAWLDHARAHGLRRTHRLVLKLDEAAQTVRVREFSSQIDWSAGAGGGKFSWQANRGIVFFQTNHERVYGLQLDSATGRLQPVLSYQYTFNLQELKAPLINAVLAAGWAWKPVLFDAPPWLRWALE